MKNAKKKFGLILYKKENEKEFEKIFNKVWDKTRITKKESYLGHQSEKQGWVIYQIRANAFLTYRDFDNFLYMLSEDLGLSGMGMVLGHNDNDGFFWMDYPEKPINYGPELETINKLKQKIMSDQK